MYNPEIIKKGIVFLILDLKSLVPNSNNNKGVARLVSLLRSAKTNDKMANLGLFGNNKIVDKVNNPASRLSLPET